MSCSRNKVSYNITLRGKSFRLDYVIPDSENVFVIAFVVLKSPQRVTNKLSTQTGGYSKKNWVGVCGPLPKTLTLFMTKISDFPYPIYDLTKI